MQGESFEPSFFLMMLIVRCYMRIESTSAKPALSLTATITEGADEELVLVVV